MSILINSYRYPGVKPFQADEKELFFGRDKDIKDLFNLIHIEKLVVLFGKSGYGKSSLLNAGIIPALSDFNKQYKEIFYEPILVRFGAYSKIQDNHLNLTNRQHHHSLLGILLTRLDEILTSKSEQVVRVLHDISTQQSLWHTLKTKQRYDVQHRFVIIFDQFEEFFTYPVSEQKAFSEELSLLLYQDMPKSVKEVESSFDRSVRLLLSEPLDVRVVFTIRSDKMSLLDTIKGDLPAILYKRFQLKGLSAEQARDAIIQPAQIHNSRFDTPVFTFSPAAIDIILQELRVQNNITSYESDIKCIIRRKLYTDYRRKVNT